MVLKFHLMFGTDFDVMYFTGIVTLQSYYDKFKSIFSLDNIRLLLHDNPIKFLGV